MELDSKEIDLYGDKARAFRLSEGRAFAEGMRQKVASTLFYGDSNVVPDEFNGLAMRYPNSTSAPHVLSAGGTTGQMTSLWLVSWGDSAVHGIYPKGSAGGLKNKDLGSYMSADESGNKFEVVGDLYSWDCGLAVRDWRAVVRIANIPVSMLAKRKGETGYVDLQALTIKAKNLMPQHLRDKAVWYCNSQVLTALELQSTDAGNVHMNYGDFLNAQAVPVIHGRPLRQCDVIKADESVI